jgi:hypothetical protein
MPQSFTVPSDLVLIIPRFRLVGGAKTESEKIRTDEEGNRLEVESKVVRTIDNTAEYEDGKYLVRAALRKVERVASYNPIGLTCQATLTDDGKVPQIEAGLNEIRPEIEKYNGRAVYSKVEASYLAIPISAGINGGTARALADHVRGTFERIKDAILGDTGKLHAAMVASENVEDLAVGVQREACEVALQQAREQQREIRARVKRGVTPTTAGNDLPVDMIEAAIALFTY